MYPRALKLNFLRRNEAPRASHFFAIQNNMHLNQNRIIITNTYTLGNEGSFRFRVQKLFF